MNLHRMRLACTLTTVFAAAISTAIVCAAAPAEKEITLSGCLIRGEGDGAGYLLTNHPIDLSAQSTAGGHVMPGTVGTTGAFANVFYWLDGGRDLRKHIGRAVEIEGHTNGDVKDAEMKVNSKDNWTER